MENKNEEVKMDKEAMEDNVGIIDSNELESNEDNNEVSEENNLDSLKEEYEKKLKECEDKYLKVHADFDNIKKRLEREKFQAIEYASEKFAKDILAPLDSLEMALNAAKNPPEGAEVKDVLLKLEEGIELTIKKFLDVFSKHGIEVVDTSNFDPNYHNAVMQSDSEEHNDGDIIQVLQKGYTYKNRLLREAMVSICKK